MFNSGTCVITQNRSSAEIIRTDVLVEYGVVHVDRVLLNADAGLERVEVVVGDGGEECCSDEFEFSGEQWNW